MQNSNTIFIISLLIIMLGYAARRAGLLKENDGDALSRVVFTFTLPATIIATFSDMQIDRKLFFLPVISIVYSVFMILLAFVIFRNLKRQEKGMVTMQFASFNIGLFAYPIVETIWGKTGLKYFATFDMGNSLMLFVVAYIIAHIYSTEKGMINYRDLASKVFSSVPLLVYIITVILLMMHLPFPKPVISFASVVSKANMPLSLLLLGSFLNFSFEWSQWKRMIQMLLVRYGIGISCGLLLYFLLPVEQMFRTALLICLNLPISLAVVPFAVECGYDKKFVGTVNNATIVISFFLMWICVNLVNNGVL